MIIYNQHHNYFFKLFINKILYKKFIDIYFHDILYKSRKIN
jgi:hypothetical protein